MKKGISIWSFPGDMVLKDCMLLAAEAGFEGIELALDEKGPIGLECTDHELDEIRDMAKDSGLVISSVATGLYWTYSLTSSDETTRQKALRIARRQIDVAAHIGADTVLIVPGAVGVDFLPSAEVVDYELAYERAQMATRELAEYAGSHGIQIGLENVWNKFLLSPLEMRSFIDSIGSSFVGSYLDIGNTLYTGYPEQWIRILGKRIRKVHLKDYRRAVGSASGFVDLLSGDVDFPAVMEALAGIGYDGYLTAEMIPPVPFYRHYPEQLIFNTSASMDRILGRK